MKWISCTDKMPPENVAVLFWINQYQETAIGQFYNGRWYPEYSGFPGIDGSKISHWMPLPQSPFIEGGEQNG